MDHRPINGIGSTIRKFNRFELKYLLPIEATRPFRQELSAYLQPDDHGNGDGHYAVSSLYYDSPGYRFYWEKMEGIKFRRKLRIRHYETQAKLAPDTEVFVEIKQRLDRVTQKRRALLPYKDALKLCNERTIPAHRPQDRLVIEEIHAMVWQYNLRPTSLVSYLRQAYVGTDYDVGLRVTFDTNLRYRSHDLQLHSKQIGRFMAPPRAVVMEVKVNERIPYWLTELVGKHNFRLVRVSKYCQSLEAANRVPQSRYHIV
jgi:SPX domain protein involved in polyphosphate accumulation